MDIFDKDILVYHVTYKKQLCEKLNMLPYCSFFVNSVTSYSKPQMFITCVIQNKELNNGNMKITGNSDIHRFYFQI